MRVLITGVAGFLGSHLADLMLEHGHEVVGIEWSRGLVLKPDQVLLARTAFDDLAAGSNAVVASGPSSSKRSSRPSRVWLQPDWLTCTPRISMSSSLMSSTMQPQGPIGYC